MTNKEFNAVVERTLETVKDVLISKGNEYTLENDDRLENFKHGAALLKTSTVEAIKGYMTKHIVSIYDMTSSDKKFTEQEWDAKIVDAINYLLLLKAAIIEDLNTGKEVDE